MIIEVIEGQVVRISNYTGPISAPTGGFRDDTGTLVDPTSPTLRVEQPGGTITTYTSGLVHDATGLYHYDVYTSGFPGRWTFAWSSVTPQTYAADFFNVDIAPI